MVNSSKIHEFLINPKVVKISTILAFSTAFSCLLIGYIIAQFGAHGYNMIDNFISDMGSIVYTPFPYMRTISNLTASPLFLPLAFYMKNRLASKENSEIPEKQLKYGKFGFIGMLTLFIGMIFTGIITEDVSYFVHSILAVIAIFGGFIATVFYGLLIVKFPTDIHKNIGILMLLMFPILITLTLIGIPSMIFYEWVLLFSLYAWMIACSISLLKTA